MCTTRPIPGPSMSRKREVKNNKMSDSKDRKFRSTTVLIVRHRGKVVMAGDGQVTLGDTVYEKNRQKGSPPVS